MTNDLGRNQSIQRHMPLAGQIAGRFLASHHSFERDDARQIAMLALIEAVDNFVEKPGGRTIAEHVTVSVEGAFRREGKRAAERRILAPTVAVIGLEDGDPLNSLRDLRSAHSLNPRADISSGMCEAIGEVRSSAVIQSCSQHPEHDYYDWTAAINRERVEQIRATYAVHTMARVQHAPAAVPLPRAA